MSVFVLKYNSELRNLQIIPKYIPPFISQPGDVSDRPAPRVFNVLAKFGIFPSGNPVVFPNFYVFKSSCRKEKKIRRQHWALHCRIIIRVRPFLPHHSPLASFPHAHRLSACKVTLNLDHNIPQLISFHFFSCFVCVVHPLFTRQRGKNEFWSVRHSTPGWCQYEILPKRQEVGDREEVCRDHWWIFVEKMHYRVPHKVLSRLSALA